MRIPFLGENASSAFSSFLESQKSGRGVVDEFLGLPEVEDQLVHLVNNPSRMLNSPWAGALSKTELTNAQNYLRPLHGAAIGMSVGAGVGMGYGGYRSWRRGSSFFGTLGNIGFFGTVGAVGGAAAGYGIPAVKAVSRIMKEEIGNVPTPSV